VEIHTFEKVWFVASLVLIAGFIATIAYGAVGAGVAMVDESGGTIDPDDVGTGPDAQFQPGIERTGDGYEVRVIAQQFQFVPGTTDPIRVPAGEPITFHVTSTDVTHGFQIVGTNVNVMVIPGQISEVTVTFDEPGRYGLVCHEYCGAGHHTMGGSVEVVPQDEYDGGEVSE
jgi:cytochrome c oxidase subunit 2